MTARLSRLVPGVPGRILRRDGPLRTRIATEATRRNLNMVVDSVGDGTLEALTAKIIRNRGTTGAYVVADYATVSTDLAVQRALERAVRSGRWVPEPVIRGAHKAVSEVLPSAMTGNIFDEVRLWDTTVNPPTLVASTINGTFVVADQDLWSTFLAKAL